MRARSLVVAVALLCAGTVRAQDRVPRDTVTATLGGKKITVEYGRPSLHGRAGLLHRRVRGCGGGNGERDEGDSGENRPSHGLPPARSERWPKIGATSRSEKSITAIASQVTANPYIHTARRGRKAAPSGNTAATTIVQPMR